MDEQGVEVGDLPLFLATRMKGIMPVIGLIKRRFKATKQGGYGEVNAPMAKVDGGIIE